jgi:hypothetical protein
LKSRNLEPAYSVYWLETKVNSLMCQTIFKRNWKYPHRLGLKERT